MMRSTCTWREEFSTSRDDIDWQGYNKTYVEVQTELLRELEGPIETDYVEVFAKGFHPDDYLIPQVYRIKDFCNGTTLGTVLQSEAVESTASTAWLDERSYNGGDSRSRVQQGPLTPQGLHARLIRRRFRRRKFSEKTTVEVSTPQPANHKSLKTQLRQRLQQYVHRHRARAPDVELVSQGKACVPEEPNDRDDEPDAERRLIFITNIDPPMAKTLIRTVSLHQAPSLHDALDKHLAAEAFIGVELPSIGFSRFRLSFHLPFFSLRFQDERDRRTHGNGEPIRHTEDVSFLNWPSGRPDSLEFLHEGQISSVIAGPNNLCWEAYCFVDTYFDGEDRETGFDYEQEAISGQSMDPLTHGKLNAEAPIWDPRRYFLSVFHYRLLQILSEWQYIVERVEKSFRFYDQSHECRSSVECQSSVEVETHNDRLQQDIEWTKHIILLLTKLRTCLSKSTDAYETFHLSSRDLFEDPSVQGHQLLQALDVSFDRLRLEKKKLESLVDRSSNFARMHELGLNQEALNVNKRQNQTTRSSWIMMLCASPFALTTSIFSMQKMAIPLVQYNFLSFIVVFIIFTLMGCAIYARCFDWQGVSVTCDILPRFFRRTKNAPDDIENAIADPPVTTTFGVSFHPGASDGDGGPYATTLPVSRSMYASAVSGAPIAYSASKHYTTELVSQRYSVAH